MKQISLVNIWKLSHLIFIVLIIMACFFAVERVCYQDSSYMLFRMINSGAFIAEGGRWVNILPQLIPWIFIKIGLPLNAIIICFSAMHIVVLYLIFILIGVKLNQKIIAISFLFLLIVSVNETFFDVVTETKYSLAFAALFSAFILSEKSNKLIAEILILIGGFFTHPVFCIYFIFILLYLTIFRPEKKYVKYLFIGSIIFVAKYIFIGTTNYEDSLVRYGFSDICHNFTNSFIHLYFKGLFSTQFVYFIGLFLIISFHLLFNKKYLQFFIYFMTLIFIYFLIAIIYSKGDSHMMIQKTLFLFHFILVLPLFFTWQQFSLLSQRIVLLICLASFVVAIVGIFNVSVKYTERVKVLDAFMLKLPLQSDKYIIKEDQINHEKLLATWALPHETILLSNSCLERSMSIKNFRERNDTLFLSRFPNAFRPAFGYPMANKDLNLKYFKVDESKPNLWLDSTFILGE